MQRFDVVFEARDGAALVGTLFEANAPVGAVLVGCATGAAARFYAHFAEWLARERGLTAMTFDFRGIGRSRRGKLADCDAHKHEWGLFDLPGALDALARYAPNLPLSLVGNSAGGTLAGLMDNAPRLSRIVQVAGSSGYLRNLPLGLRLQGYALMHGVMPVASAVLGYAPAAAFGWGEDLPRHVARQWAAWCSAPGYVANAFGREVPTHHYDAIRAPILNLSFTDDHLVNERNIDDILRLFTHAQIIKKRLDPKAFGLASIGHVGFFKRASQPVWPLVADFLTGETHAMNQVHERALPSWQPA